MIVILRAVVIDDNEQTREILTTMVESSGLVKVIGTASNGLSGIKIVKEASPDLVFLDIEMEPINGMETAQILSANQNRPAIIFVTGHPEYACDAFQLDAYDYILKPFDITQILRSINKIYDRFNIKNLKIKLKSNGNIIYIDCNEIMFVESYQKKTLIHLINKDIPVHDTLSSIEATLTPNKNFVRTHRSYIVNTNYIEVIEKSKQKNSSHMIRFKNSNKFALLAPEKANLL